MTDRGEDSASAGHSECRTFIELAIAVLVHVAVRTFPVPFTRDEGAMVLIDNTCEEDLMRWIPGSPRGERRVYLYNPGHARFRIWEVRMRLYVAEPIVGD